MGDEPPENMVKLSKALPKWRIPETSLTRVKHFSNDEKFVLAISSRIFRVLMEHILTKYRLDS